MPKFTSDDYGEGYWERAEGSNYVNYGDDSGWLGILHVINANHTGKLNIIEAACSKGYFLRAALLDGHKALGFDVSEYAIRNAVTKTAMVHDAIEPWPYPSGSADLVCAWEFLEHIHEENISLVLEEIDRVLKPGGEMWFKTGIIVPDDHDFAGQEDHDHTHVNMQTREWWETLFVEFLGYERLAHIEDELDEMFRDRDWKGRFFVYRKPHESTKGT